MVINDTDPDRLFKNLCGKWWSTNGEILGREEWNMYLIVFNIYINGLIFRDIPINLLLWWCESWALRETTLQKLEIFLHRSTRKILRIDITQVIDERITNGSIRTRFFSIPTIRDQIAQRQLTFIGKVVQNKDNQLPTQLLTAWCNNKRKRGDPL